MLRSGVGFAAVMKLIGQRFLMVNLRRIGNRQAASHVAIMFNWFEDMRQRVPASK